MPISGTATYVSGTTWLLERSCDYACSFCSFRDTSGTWKSAIDDVVLPSYVATGDVVEIVTGTIRRSNPWLRRHIERLIDACTLVTQKSAHPILPLSCVPNSHIKYVAPHVAGFRLHVDVFGTGEIPEKQLHELVETLRIAEHLQKEVSLVVLVGAGESQREREEVLQQLAGSTCNEQIVNVALRPYVSAGVAWQPAYQLTPQSIGACLSHIDSLFPSATASVQISGVSDWWLLLDEGLQDFDVLRSSEERGNESGSIFVPPSVVDVENVLQGRNMLLAERTWSHSMALDDRHPMVDNKPLHVESNHQTNLF